MGNPTRHDPVLRLMAVITRHADALEWAIERASVAWGPIALRSPTFAFDETTYYEATMGPGLGKTFLVFEQFADAGELADWKFATNDWEAEYAALRRHDEPRPLNLDPGYLTLAKLVLASTKDHAHRMYLGRGMYAEVTLFYRHGAWQGHEFTFPDYRRPDYHAFFMLARARLRNTGPAAKQGLP
ncbi:MAG TPA: DUF4416 family protein [Pirellulales bacterium]|nr:DUF4416 family protein [Pirellulales bacterium]